MGDTDFYLVLASNVSPEIYPKNRAAHFYTPLNQNLYFDRPGWSVALKEITYQNTIQTIVDEYIEVWQDIFEKRELVEKCLLPNPGKYIGMEIMPDKRVKYYLKWKDTDFTNKFHSDDIVFVIEEINEENKTVVINENSYPDVNAWSWAIPHLTRERWVSLHAKPKPRVLERVQLTPAYYHNRKKLCEEINSKLAPWEINFSVVVEDGGERRIQLTQMPTTGHIALKNGLQYILGFPDEDLKSAPMTALYKEDLSRGLAHMFIYCDMIEPVVVGDSLVPLLKAVPCTSKEHGAIVNHVFNPSLYVPIEKTIVHTIEIEIRTDAGEPFPLTSDGKVILTLHVKNTANK